MVDGKGPGTAHWVSPANGRHADGLVATVELDGNGVTTWLEARAFGLALPADAVVRGFSVKVVRRGDDFQEITDEGVALLRSGTPTPTKRSLPGFWASLPKLDTVTYGGATDTWGETWTAADVASPTFGVAFAARGQEAAAAEAQVDHIELTVHFERCKP